MKAIAFAILCWVSLVPAAAHAGMTVITHGFEPISGEVPDWPFSMAQAILRADGDTSDCGAIGMQTRLGTVFVYDTDSGDWLFECGSPTPVGEIVLVFDWSQESDGFNIGGTQGFAEAAADALYGALRDPILPPAFSGVDLLAGALHFIGHSRGAVVNSDCVERLGSVGIDVDHVTTLDPHPVDGTLDEPLDFADWGDRSPVTWTSVAFADNYWRADGGGFPSALDFDGMSLDTDVDLDLGEAIEFDFHGLDDDPIGLEHTEVHAWYYGTVDLAADDDGAGTDIDDETADWWGEGEIPDRNATGFFYSTIVGGPRPGPIDGEDPERSPLSLYNGNFEIVNTDGVNAGVGYAGWFYHGGDRSGTLVEWSSSDPPPGSQYYLSLSSGADTEGLTHNRVYIDDSVTEIELFQRNLSPSNDDRFRITLSDGFADSTIGDAPLTGMTPWTKVSFPIPTENTGKTYTIRFEIVDESGGVESEVDIDDIRFVPEPDGTSAVVAVAVVGVLSWTRRGGRADRGRPVERSNEGSNQRSIPIE